MIRKKLVHPSDIIGEFFFYTAYKCFVKVTAVETNKIILTDGVSIFSVPIYKFIDKFEEIDEVVQDEFLAS